MGIANETFEINNCTSGEIRSGETEVIVEAPVSLTLNGDLWLTFMCTPVDLDAMAVGFLFNEGLIASIEEVASVRVCPNLENIDVWLTHRVDAPDRWRRTSGCTGGVTGVDSDLAGSGVPLLALSNGFGLYPAQVSALVSRLFESQDLYRKAGGVHTSALSDGESIFVVAEDIGRHNTLDKIAGRYLLDGIDLSRRVLITTGRVSSEMLQKSARLGASVVISRTAPSSLSIHMAERWGITLIGYARRDRFKVYTHPERILSEPVRVAQVGSQK